MTRLAPVRHIAGPTCVLDQLADDEYAVANPAENRWDIYRQTAPQSPDVDPQPRRGSVADTAGIFDGPDSVEWLREQRGVPMIPDLLGQAYGADALAAVDRLEASTHDASGGPPAPHRRPSEDPT